MMAKQPHSKIIFSHEQEQDVIDMYVNQNISTVKIAQKYNCSHKVIARLLEEHNIPRTGKSRRKYRLNETYFDCIDSQNKAYILGFLWADGSNCISKSTISMSLQCEDKSTLEAIRCEIGSEHPLEFIDYSNKHDFGYTYKNQYRLLMFSKHMCNTLNDLSMVPNKSLVVQYPDIDEEYHSAFIRGVFDGDGYCNKTGYSCSITGTYALCARISQIIADYGVESRLNEASNHNGLTYVLTISKKASAKKFLDYIYGDAEMFLERKYKIYLDHYCTIAA